MNAETMSSDSTTYPSQSSNSKEPMSERTERDDTRHLAKIHVGVAGHQHTDEPLEAHRFTTRQRLHLTQRHITIDDKKARRTRVHDHFAPGDTIGQCVREQYQEERLPAIPTMGDRAGFPMPSSSSPSNIFCCPRRWPILQWATPPPLAPK